MKNKKIKLSLLGVLFAGSALAITMPIVSCSGSTSPLVKVSKSSNYNAKVSNINQKMKTAFQGTTAKLKAGLPGKTYEEQKALYNKIVQDDYLESINDIVNDLKDAFDFNDNNKKLDWDDVVDGIDIVGKVSAFPPKPTNANEVKIPGFKIEVELEIEFEYELDDDNDTRDVEFDLIVSIDDLGFVSNI